MGSEAKELKLCPVPWCKSKNLEVVNRNHHPGSYIQCKDCLASTAPCLDHTLEEITTLWNNRPTADERLVNPHEGKSVTSHLLEKYNDIIDKSERLVTVAKKAYSLDCGRKECAAMSHKVNHSMCKIHSDLFEALKPFGKATE